MKKHMAVTNTGGGKEGPQSRVKKHETGSFKRKEGHKTQGKKMVNKGQRKKHKYKGGFSQPALKE